VDIKLSNALPTDAERAAVDAVLGPPASGWDGGERDAAKDSRMAVGGHSARERRDELLPALHAVQDRVGWISEGALQYICKRLTVPPAEAWGVVTFYHLLATEPRAPRVAHVCDDLACRLRGAESLCDELDQRLGKPGTSKDGVTTWLRSPCLGQCERAPAAMVLSAGEPRRTATLTNITSVEPIVAALSDSAEFATGAWDPAAVRRSVPQSGSADLRLLRRVGVADPTRLDDYRAHGGYLALPRALAMGAEQVIAEVTASKLVGRGGAAFPTGRKWDAVGKAPALPHYLVCNADESEPGTFKDRILLEEDPFAIVEAMTIAGIATGCEHGYLYLRGEYPDAERRFLGALDQARAAGFLGNDILGSGRSFDIEIRRGAGAYICGEETALFNSIEGKRGEPRSKPPFPVAVGLFGKPTVVNNVETLASIPAIVLGGGAAFAALGTAGSSGSKLFCVCGDVEQAGLYEVPFGTALGDLLARAGGVLGGRALRAILMGGAAGSFVGPDALAMPLSFEGARAAATTLGSGVVLVYAEGSDVSDGLARIAEFFRHESCGQCVPCRVGTERQLELIERLRHGKPLGGVAAELVLLKELGQAMRDASICGLGQTASSAIESAVAKLDPFSHRTSTGDRA